MRIWRSACLISSFCFLNFLEVRWQKSEAWLSSLRSAWQIQKIEISYALQQHIKQTQHFNNAKHDLHPAIRLTSNKKDLFRESSRMIEVLIKRILIWYYKLYPVIQAHCQSWRWFCLKQEGVNPLFIKHLGLAGDSVNIFDNIRSTALLVCLQKVNLVGAKLSTLSRRF